jgi:hypothetical protein
MSRISHESYNFAFHESIVLTLYDDYQTYKYKNNKLSHCTQFLGEASVAMAKSSVTQGCLDACLPTRTAR